MFNAFFKALGDLASPDFRSVLFKAVGLTIALFLAILVGLQVLFYLMTFVPWPWFETILAIGSTFLLVVAFFFLMAPVTAVFAGLFLDEIAGKVEAKHYPKDKIGTSLSTGRAVVVALQFAGVVLVANIAALPLVFTGFGIFVLLIINAYLISREYFEMAAMRHMPPDEAKELRRANAVDIFTAGFVPAVLAVIPFVNLTVPLFSTSYFVHIYKSITSGRASSL